MAKLSVAALVVCAGLTAACGGSPTSPQPPGVSASTSGVNAPNAPAPPPSNPSPTAPAPAPSPEPAPAPTPPTNPVETWLAVVDVQRAASASAELPPTFTVTVRGDQMQFGPLEVTILARQGRHIYARKGVGLTIQIDDNTWTVTSVELFAAGTISYSTP